MPRTALHYRLLARVAFGALPLLAPFSGKLAGGLAGRRASLAKLKTWAAAHRDRTRPLLWFHAPSVGEGLQARAILELIRSHHPDWQIAFTHFSPSAEKSAARQPADVHAYLPADVPHEVDAALDALAPSALVFVKLDVWPELACRAASRAIPVLLVAGTVSPVSGRTGWPARAFTRSAYGALSAVGAIAEDDAARLAGLGVPRDRIAITGDPRFDSVVSVVEAARREAPVLPPSDAPLLIAGSTWPLDEAVLLEAYAKVRESRPDVRLVLAPHEPTPAHLDALDSAARRLGLVPPVRYSNSTGIEPLIAIDQVGLLARLYGSGASAFVGGGFGRAGLHSVLEPAAWGIPVLFGPNWQSSREAGLLLESGGAVTLPATGAAARLAEVWLGWINNENARKGAGDRALQVVASGKGGADNNAKLIERAIANR